jgi:type I restriction enzyme S subunit
MNKPTAALLEQHFDTAFNAPDGLKKLRELILTLAMQGKLVPQDPSAPPASALLKEIEADKKRLVKEGKIKTPKPLPPVTEEEKPYALPQGWEWVRLGEIGIINPRNEADDSVNAGFVPMPMIPEGYSENHQFEIRPWHEIKKGYTHFADGDVGMAKITPCFENAKSCVFSGLPNGIGAGTTELHIFRNTFRSVIPRFLLYYIKNPHSISKAVPKMTGSAGQKRVPTTYFTEQLFPLPPLPEQHRIVAKIDELMARCDALEKLRTAQSEKRLSVHAAAIQQLLNIAEPAQHQRAQAFLADHFGDLYTVKENVSELRKAILQLAVMGKLVPQNPSDPPASELLKEIEAEKKRLVKEGKIKAPKPLPPVTEQEKPYGLPQGWEWVRLGEICDYNGRGNIAPESIAADAWLLDLEDIEKNTSRLIYRAKYSERESKSTKSTFQAGDVLYGKLRPYLDKVIVADTDGVCTTEIVPIVPSQAINSEFLRLLLKRPAFLTHVNSLMYGVKMPRLGTEHAVQSVHPLPPVPEQHRIVAKIDELMVLCDSLDQQIDAATAKQAALLHALMAQV